MLLVAEITAGWVVGFTIGVVVVLVVAVLVITIAVLAARIGDRARVAIKVLERVREDTSSLHAVDTVNSSAVRVLEGARAARTTLTGG
ncbi:MAG: hypothetical protein M3469_08050 [Actinomycetota bacterium]|nr:hypothetical protein [Actinomycetota bacterium]